jgi:hypothetical protein
MKATDILAGIILATAMVSCEFPLEEENNVEVQRPPDTVMINLSLVPVGDTILITGPTTLSYNINTYNLTMYIAVFSLIDRTWELENPVGSFYVDPHLWSNGYYPLTLAVYTNSGSGSLADHVGAEGYLAEKQWTIMINKTEPVDTSDVIHKPILTYSITKDKFLKVTWQKCVSDDFDNYQIECTSSHFIFYHEIAEAKDSFYIDTCYVGDSVSYRVCINTKPSIGTSIWSDPLVVNEPFPTMEIEQFGLDSLRIVWNKSKFKCRYSLFYSKNYEFIVSMDTIRSIVVDHPGFPDDVSFTLFTVPFYALSEQDPYTCSDLKNYGSMPDAPGNSRYFAFNVIDDILYTSTSNNFEAYSGSDLNLLNSNYISFLGNCGQVTSMLNTTQIATISSENIYIFQDQFLTTPKVIPFQNWEDWIDHFFLADNGILTVTKFKTEEVSVIDVNQETILYTSLIENYPSSDPRGRITASSDGKYFACVSESGANIYEILTDSLKEIYSDNRAYRSACFNPNSPDQLVLTLLGNDEIEIRHCPDFSLYSSIYLFPVTIRNFDPKTGYMLVHDFYRFYVFDIETEELLFSMNSNDYESVLLGNRLFSPSGHTFDISNYLKK